MSDETKHRMKPHTKIVLGTVGALAIVAGATAWATAGSDHGHRGWHGKGHHKSMIMEHVVQRFDADGDGALSRAEIDAGRSQLFASADVDGDGLVSLDEFRPVWTDVMEPGIVRSFQRLDADGDASLTADEVERPVDWLFSRMDRNDDGVIDRSDRKRGSWHDDDDDDDDDDDRS